MLRSPGIVLLNAGNYFKTVHTASCYYYPDHVRNSSYSKISILCYWNLHFLIIRVLSFGPVRIPTWTILNIIWLYVSSNLSFSWIFNSFFKPWETKLTKSYTYNIQFWKIPKNVSAVLFKVLNLIQESLAKKTNNCFFYYI
jgi:hypothetical protein